MGFGNSLHWLGDVHLSRLGVVLVLVTPWDSNDVIHESVHRSCVDPSENTLVRKSSWERVEVRGRHVLSSSCLLRALYDIYM